MAISCSRALPPPSPNAVETHAPPVVSAATTEETPEPLSSAQAANPAPPVDTWFELDIPGHEPAIVSMPATQSGPIPVVVAAQGLGEDPKAWCEWCRELVGSRPVVVCLRGSATGRNAAREMTWSHTSPRATQREAIEGLKALQARHPGQVDTREAVFLGFSLGANTGAQVVLEEAAAFPRAVLIEGGNEIWDRKSAPRFHAEGGRRILFACGTEGCKRWSEFSRRRLEKAGVAVKIAVGEAGGHSYREGPVSQAVRGAFSWVIEDDPRWRM